MILEGFSVTLIVLKTFDVITVSWTMVAVICTSLIAVEIRLGMQRKIIFDTMNEVARTTDGVVAELQDQIDDLRN